MSDWPKQHPSEFWRLKILSYPESLICDDEDNPLFYVNVREKVACKWLADELRKLADHIETDMYPRVYGCIVPPGEEGPKFTKTILAEWRVILSHPWGG